MRRSSSWRQGAASQHDRFWDWCAQSGITSKHLSIRAAGSVADRGLFLEESVKSGSVLASIPYKLCLNRELLGSNSRFIPPAPLLGLALHKAGLNADGAEHLWLALYLATLRVQPKSDHLAPYLSMLPNPVSMELHRKACKELLSKSELEEFHEIESETDSHVSLAGRFATRYATLRRRHARRLASEPQADAISTKKEFRVFIDAARRESVSAAHDIVISRSFPLPWGCRESSPRDLATFLEESEGTEAIPSLVPVLDLVNAAAPQTSSAVAAQSNCTLFTCSTAQFLHEGTRKTRKVVSSPASRLSRKRVVLCATRDIHAGEELLMDYNNDDAPASAYRFGFVSQGTAPSGNTNRHPA
jgi:hypothetical protein